MNKELIKKYKKEFDHWLNGGNIQVYYKTDDEPKWWVDEENIESCNNDNFSHMIKYSLDPNDVLVVIDDEYVEFRKALAEGKTVQYRNLNINAFKNWQNLENLKFNPNFEHRIKPEEPKFKVGDWVRCYYLGKELIVQITGEYYPKDDAYLCSNRPRNTKFLEHWQPKLGEWCIMYDTDEDQNANSITIQKWDGKGKWIPIPFIGQLPPYIKDINES